jgi:hypothetical protein
LEILPTGESGYMMTKTLKELQQYIHEEVVKIESGAITPKERPYISSGLSGDEGLNSPLLSLVYVTY